VPGRGAVSKLSLKQTLPSLLNVATAERTSSDAGASPAGSAYRLPSDAVQSNVASGCGAGRCASASEVDLIGDDSRDRSGEVLEAVPRAHADLSPIFVDVRLRRQDREALEERRVALLAVADPTGGDLRAAHPGPVRKLVEPAAQLGAGEPAHRCAVPLVVCVDVRLRSSGGRVLAGAIRAPGGGETEKQRGCE
jgi:hypothetical protein